MSKDTVRGVISKWAKDYGYFLSDNEVEDLLSQLAEVVKALYKNPADKDGYNYNKAISDVLNLFKSAEDKDAK